MKRIKGFRRGRPRDERGATFILVAICMVLLLWGGAFGVDLGLSVVGTRQTQAIADTSALDMARYLNIADNSATYNTQQKATTYLNSKLPYADTDNGSSATLTYTPGVWKSGTFYPYGTGLDGTSSYCYYFNPPWAYPCNAVEVTAAESVPQIFLGDKASVSRTSIAAVTPEAGFSVGSFMASVDSQQSTVLNAILGLLGSTPTVTAVGYEGLANTDVSINQLVAASGGLLTTSNVLTTSLTGAQWLAIWSDAVANQVALLNCGASPTPLPCEASTGLSALDFSASTSDQLCQLVSINGSTCGTTLSTAALATSLNVLQMLTTEAELANNNNALDLGTSLGITGVTDAKLTLDLTQIPQVALGPVTTTAETAQVSSDLQLTDPGLGGVFNIPLSAVDGTATLETLTCANNSLTKAAIQSAITTATGSVTLAGVGIATLTTANSPTSFPYTSPIVPPTATTVAAGTNPEVVSTILSYSGLSSSSSYYTFLTSTLAGVLGPVLQAAGVAARRRGGGRPEHQLRSRGAGEMNAPPALLGGAALGVAAGCLLVPLTRRALAASLARSSARNAPVDPVRSGDHAAPRITRGHWVALALVSGLLPAYVLHRVGWSVIALPPLLLLVGLVQLAYCDLRRRLLPKTLVYALSAAVIVSGVVIAGVMHEWERLVVAALGGLAFFALFFVINLMNPRWMAFGDVRLSFVVGFGLAWVSPIALLEGFFFANLLAAVTGLVLIAAHRAERRSAVPFGFYLALGAALVLLTWS